MKDTFHHFPFVAASASFTVTILNIWTVISQLYDKKAKITWLEKAASQISVPRAIISCDVWLVKITGNDITCYTVQQSNRRHSAGKNQSVSVTLQLYATDVFWDSNFEAKAKCSAFQGQ